MSNIKESGFKTSEVLSALSTVFEQMSEAEKKKQIKTVLRKPSRETNGIFQLNVKNGQGKEAIWVIDLKNEGNVTKGAAKKPDVTITLSDDTFLGLADGKVNAQKAFMTGSLKVKGNVMLATKLDGVLKVGI
nr:sterol-binding protein [Cryptococcus depauperatus CBS 7855]